MNYATQRIVELQAPWLEADEGYACSVLRNDTGYMAVVAFIVSVIAAFGAAASAVYARAQVKEAKQEFRRQGSIPVVSTGWVRIDDEPIVSVWLRNLGRGIVRIQDWGFAASLPDRKPKMLYSRDFTSAFRTSSDVELGEGEENWGVGWNDLKGKLEEHNATTTVRAFIVRDTGEILFGQPIDATKPPDGMPIGYR